MNFQRSILIFFLLGIHILWANISCGQSRPIQFYVFNDTLDYDTLSERERVIEIYNWITHHISYDAESFYSFNGSYILPEDVIKHKKATCIGYSNLFKALSESVGIKCYTIEGYFKDLDYYPDKKFYASNHVWNVVNIEGSYELVDVTQGSGFIEFNYPVLGNLTKKLTKKNLEPSSFKFERSPDPFYLFVSPDSLISTHSPTDPIWQLTDYHVSMDDFVKSSDKDSMFNNLILNTYNDSIQRYIHSSWLEQLDQQISRGLNYNSKNQKFVSDLYFEVAKKYFDMAAALPPSDGRIERLKKSIEFGELAFTYGNNYSDIIKSEFEENLAREKGWNIKRVKSDEKTLKSNDKSISSNHKTVQKSAALKSRFGKEIKKLKKAASDVVYDDKIYDIDKPRAPNGRPDETKASEAIMALKQNQEVINKLKGDNQKLLQHESDSLLLKLTNIRKEFIETVVTNLPVIEQNIKFVQSLNPSYYPNIDSNRFFIESRRDSINTLRQYSDKQGVIDLKNIYKKVENNQFSLIKLMEQNKKYYLELMKSSEDDHDETSLYELENENIANEYHRLIGYYEGLINYFNLEKELITEEKKVLKAENKKIASFIEAEKARYSYTKSRLTLKNKTQKESNKNEIKAISKLIKEANNQIDLVFKEKSNN